MKCIRSYFRLMLFFVGMSNLIVAIGESDNFINDVIDNRSSEDISVQVQFNKSIPIDNFRSSTELKKYAMQTQVTRVAEYVVKPTKELKLYEAFISANPLGNKEYWYPTNVTISANGLSLSNAINANDIVQHLIKSKRYVVSLINNELQVETENTLK